MRNRKIWTDQYGIWHRKSIDIPSLSEERLPLMSASHLSEQKAAAFYNAGWEIFDGNNENMPNAKKWANFYVVTIRRTNSKRHGHCINTTFAVKRAEA